MTDSIMNLEKNNQSENSSDCVHRIRLHYHDMSDAERKLADFFLSRDENEPFSDTVKQLAERIGVSVASVIRFCHSLGYSGYAEFKLMLRDVSFIPSIGNITLNENMSAAQLKKNIGDFASLAIQTSLNTIDNEQLQSAIDMLRAASHIYICGIGTSAGIAVAAANTFMNLDIGATPLVDELLMMRAIKCAGDKDVVIAITNCGYIKPIVDAMYVAKENNLKVILFTGNAKSLAIKYADSVLLTNNETKFGVLDMLSITVSQLITIQTLQAGYLAGKSSQELSKIAENFRQSDMARYSEKVKMIKNERVKY